MMIAAIILPILFLFIRKGKLIWFPPALYLLVELLVSAFYFATMNESIFDKYTHNALEVLTVHLLPVASGWCILWTVDALLIRQFARWNRKNREKGIV
jgi:hypothetical protein